MKKIKTKNSRVYRKNTQQEAAMTALEALFTKKKEIK